MLWFKKLFGILPERSELVRTEVKYASELYSSKSIKSIARSIIWSHKKGRDFIDVTVRLGFAEFDSTSCESQGLRVDVPIKSSDSIVDYRARVTTYLNQKGYSIYDDMYEEDKLTWYFKVSLKDAQ